MDILKTDGSNNRHAIHWYKHCCSVLVVCAGLLLAGCPTVTTGPAPKANGLLELYKHVGKEFENGSWELKCTIPLPPSGTKGEVAVYMDSNSYGCHNDEVDGYKLISAGVMSFGFYDKKCGDIKLYDDDYFEYSITAFFVTTDLVKSFSTNVAIGQEVRPNVKYISGSWDNGIDGKLSCVRFFSISNAGGISGS